MIIIVWLCRWLGRVQRGATSLAYWGIFSGTEYCGSDKFPNKLWYFPLVNIRAPASVPIPYIFSPRFFGGCIIRLADWTCLSCFIGSTDWDKGLPHR